jgi:hypothetical protein
MALRPKTVALVAATLSGCTAVTTVTVTPNQLHALAGMGPNEERRFTAIDEDEAMVAKGEDDVRVRVTPIGALAGERPPPVQEEPWGKLYTLRWGASVTLAPTVQSGSSTADLASVPATEVTGGELRMNRYSGTRTLILVLCIAGPIVATAISLGILAALGAAGFSLGGGG